MRLCVSEGGQKTISCLLYVCEPIQRIILEVHPDYRWLQATIFEQLKRLQLAVDGKFNFYPLLHLEQVLANFFIPEYMVLKGIPGINRLIQLRGRIAQLNLIDVHKE